MVETAPQEGNMVLFLGIVSQLFVLPPRSEWTIANLYNIMTMAIIMLSANHIYTVAHDWCTKDKALLAAAVIDPLFKAGVIYRTFVLWLSNTIKSVNSSLVSMYNISI